jgi:hypothetical protein
MDRAIRSGSYGKDYQMYKAAGTWTESPSPSTDWRNNQGQITENETRATTAELPSADTIRAIVDVVDVIVHKAETAHRRTVEAQRAECRREAAFFLY